MKIRSQGGGSYYEHFVDVNIAIYDLSNLFGKSLLFHNYSKKAHLNFGSICGWINRPLPNEFLEEFEMDVIIRS